MAKERHRLKLWGVRGTVPTPNSAMLGYGGHTICLGGALGDDEYLVLDCGTGARPFGAQIAAARRGKPTRIHILFSHFHFDHVEGLPLFLPLYDPSSSIVFRGFAPEGRSLRAVLEGLIAPPYFPVRLDGTPAQISYAEIRDRTPFAIGDVEVATLPLNHPDGSLAYRLERHGRRIVFATDHEHGIEPIDAALVEFCRGADHLIYDATYMPAEYESMRRGWGHSTWYAAVRTAQAAGVGNLLLFHHHPEHRDADLDAVGELARSEFPSTTVAREGLELEL